MNLKNVRTPQTIYIVGKFVGDEEDAITDAVFKVTDDESAFAVKVGITTIGLECDGFGSILTEEEFKKGQEMWKAEYAYGVDFVKLENFSGVIELIATDDISGDELEFDINDYIQHQFDEYTNIIVKVNKTNWDKGYIDEDHVLTIMPKPDLTKNRLYPLVKKIILLEDGLDPLGKLEITPEIEDRLERLYLFHRDGI